MDLNTDHEVLRAATEWLDHGDAVVLVTVADTWGSAPRRPGALMVIHSDGRFVGSVSGGCVEDDLVQRVLRGEFAERPPQLVEYGISESHARGIGLPCGGRLQLLVEYLQAAAPLRQILERVRAHGRVERRVCLTTGEVSLHADGAGVECVFDGHQLTRLYGPLWRVLIIGAGELTRRVAQLALTLDYAVTICDSRPEYASGWEVDGTAFSTLSSEAFVQRFVPDERTAVIALAHAPPLEDKALAAALKTSAFYIGALGSRKNQRARLERLRKLGLDAAQLERLHGPIGLDIGSHTPAEIAIAISADLVKSRNQLVSQQRLADG